MKLTKILPRNKLTKLTHSLQWYSDANRTRNKLTKLTNSRKI